MEVENMRTTLKIEGVETKTSQKGKEYTSYQTSQGRMSCFEGAVVKELNSNMGQEVEVEVQERGDFKNITGVYAIPAVGEEAPLIGKKVTIVDNKFSEARASKDLMMKVSYAKDIFIALFGIVAEKVKKSEGLSEVLSSEVIMDKAVELVKRAETKLSQ